MTTAANACTSLEVRPGASSRTQPSNQTQVRAVSKRALHESERNFDNHGTTWEGKRKTEAGKDDGDEVVPTDLSRNQSGERIQEATVQAVLSDSKPLAPGEPSPRAPTADQTCGARPSTFLTLT